MVTSEHALDEPIAATRPTEEIEVSSDPLCAGYPAAKNRRRQAAVSAASPAIYAKRHVVFDENETAEMIYQVVSGAVILTRSNGAGQRRVIEVVGPGGILGVVSGDQYGHRAETMTRTTLRRISRRSVERSANLQRLVGQALTRKLEKLHEETSLRTRMTATGCVAALILSLPKAADRPSDEEAGEGDYRLALPQSDMASYLGLAIETVCRAMKNLKRAGAIRTSGRDSIVIIDAEALGKLAAVDQVEDPG